MEELPYEVLSTCTNCRVESAVLEVFEPNGALSRRGLPTQASCRLCGFKASYSVDGEGCELCVAEVDCGACGTVVGKVTVAGVRLIGEPERAHTCLAGWAATDGFDADEFCESNLGVSLQEAISLLTSGEEVPTLFDVMAFLFPGSGGGGGGAGREFIAQTRVEPKVSSPKAAVEVNWARTLLASVLVADGVQRPEELSFVNQWLNNKGESSLKDWEITLRRPNELGLPPSKEEAKEAVKAAIALLWIDGYRDESEWRVVEEYALSAGIEPSFLQQIDRKYRRKGLRGLFGF